MIPRLRFPEFTDHWQIKKLGDIFSFKNGLNADKSQYGSGIKYISVSDIIDNPFITYDAIKGSVAASNSDIEKNNVVFGDVLFQRSSETREEVGQANIYVDEKPAIFGGFVIRGKAKTKDNPYFMNYLLHTKKVRKDITSRSGGSTRYNIGQDALNEVTIDLPGVYEQKKVAEFLGLVDERIGDIERKLEVLMQYKGGVIQALFSGKLRFKDKNGNSYPDWEERAVADISYSETSPLSANQIKGKSGRYKVYGASGVLQTLDRYHYEDEYIAVVKDGAGVGRISLCEPKSSVLGTMIVIQPKKHNDKKFLYYLLNLVDFKKYTTGSTIPHVYFKQYSKQKFNIPIVSEQRKIADFLSALDDKIKLEEVKLASAQEFKKALLQRMFV